MSTTSKKKNGAGYLAGNAPEQLATRSFELHCPLMKLSGPSGVLKGSGYIRQAQDFGLEFHLMSQWKGDVFEALKRGLRRKTGVLISEFEQLDATDTEGNEWTAERVIADRSCGTFESASGRLSQIVTYERLKAGSGSSLELLVPANFQFAENASSELKRKLPNERILEHQWNRDTAVVEVAAGSLLVSRQAEFVSLFYESGSSTLPPELNIRTMDALSFLSNSPVDYFFSRKYGRGRVAVTIRGTLGKYRSSGGYPPVPREDPENYWSLFRRFVESSPGQPEANKRGPLGSRTHAVVLSNQLPLEAQALAVTTCSEGLLELETGGPKQVPELAKHLRLATRAIRKAAIPKALANRIAGQIGALQRLSASDKLHDLVRAGFVSQEEFDAWRKLRNSITHGVMLESDQSTVDAIGHVRTLFNKLVFRLIGYQGRFYDFGAPNWPVIKMR